MNELTVSVVNETFSFMNFLLHSLAVFVCLSALGGFEWGGFFLQLPADAGAGAEEQEQTALTRHTDWWVSAVLLYQCKIWEDL